MTPEERLAHLLDDDRWNGPGLSARSTSRPGEPRRSRALVGALTAVVAGVVIGVLITIGVGPLRSAVLPGAATNDPVATSTSTPSSTSQPELMFTQTAGIDDAVGQRVRDAAVNAGAPLVYWNEDRTAFTVVLWGDGCAETPRRLRVAGPSTLELAFGRSDSTLVCTDQLEPSSTTFSVPAGLDATSAVTAQVTSAQMGSHSVVVLDWAALTDSTCTSGQLSARVSTSDGAAGTQYQDLVLTNSSTTACVLVGFATVEFLGQTPAGQLVPFPGTLIGSPARHETWKRDNEVVTLAAHGGAATIRLSLAQAANYPASDCTAVPSVGIAVALPGGSWSLTADWVAQVCTVDSAHQFSASDILAERSTDNPGWQP